MNLLIVQARMGSSRLPGKVLKKLGDKPILQHVIERIQEAKKVDRMLIATTTSSIDDRIELFGKEKGIPCFRGDENDVLDRYYSAAENVKPKPRVIIRITADCPLHHHEVINFAIDRFQSLDVDYFSNSNYPPDVLEDGIDTEVFSLEALKTAWKNARKASEREHVTLYIKECGKFKCGFEKFHKAYNYKLSVDNERDFLAVQSIFEHFYPDNTFSINDVVALMKERPDIAQMNKESIINEGLKKSLENDERVR